MGKALLVNPSYFRTYASNEGGIAFPVYPTLGLNSVAGAIRQRGHDVRIVDLSFRKYDPSNLRQTLREERPDVVGITATTPLANQMRDISYLVRDVLPAAITVAGGAHPSALPFETMLESTLDCVAAGEADFVVADILDGKSFDEINGLYWRSGENITINKACSLIHDLDMLPMPAWEIYPPEYNSKMTKIIARHSPVTTIEFSRGCVFNCDFCASKNTMGLGYRKKSPERCVEEVAYVERLGFRELVLVDDIFTSDKSWAAQVCEALIRRGTKVRWTCTNGIRVDSADRQLFQLMHRAGCYRVYFGLESGNKDVLKAFGKGGRATLEKGLEAIEMARVAGLEPNGFFIVGLSGDTEETMKDTIRYARKARLDTMKCGICVPFPGSPMFDDLRRKGRIKTYDWDQYTIYSAEKVFEHPQLSRDTITKYFKKFYLDCYFKNPAYVIRRLLFALRNHELVWNLYYTAKFVLTLSTKQKKPPNEVYAYEHKWRPLGVRADWVIRRYSMPKARGAASRKKALKTKSG